MILDVYIYIYIYIYIYSHYLCVFIPMKKVLYGVNVYVFVPLVFFFITKNVYA